MVDIILTAGGTGGHLFPAIATMQKLQNRGLTIKLITDGRCLPYLKNDNNIDYQVFALKSLAGSTISSQHPDDIASGRSVVFLSTKVGIPK